ncbi:hypothetical protein [Leifsonia sp. NPDC077715]|uniref:hypothetical protein n=1 Tax=Leifsonia sp. NPDC077715 TaxID=3155539 RepID=UPI00343AE2B8
MTDRGRDGGGRSLAMQRIAIGRARIFALIGIVVGAAYTLLAVVLLTSAGKPIYTFQLVLGVLILITAIVRFIAARRALSRFEQENGPDAGKQ